MKEQYVRSIVFASAAILSQAAVHGQASSPRLDFGAGASTQGFVAVAEVRVVGPLWLSGRWTGSFTLVQRAAGARLELVSARDHAFYVQTLIGDAWCYYELSGASGFCDAPAEQRPGLTLGGGFEFSVTKRDSWRLGFEGGVWRGLDSDPVSKDLEHWFAAAVFRYRLRLTPPG
jgi:hypothetical protein